jgi:hypothetical protein
VSRKLSRTAIENVRPLTAQPRPVKFGRILFVI